MPTSTSAKLIDLAESGVLDWETIAREALQVMSEDDIEEEDFEDDCEDDEVDD